MLINWGILGLGKVAEKFVADLLLSKDAKLAAVASRDKTNAEAFGKKFHALYYYDSYDALVQNPEIDVVYIATPHSFHFEHTMLCLKNGKSVLCEKPMGMNFGEVNAMITEATKRKLFLMEAMWTRFIPATEKLILLLQEKIIGEISFIRADFGFRSTAAPESRVFNKALGGGALLDIGIYPLYLSLITLGVPSEIKAVARKTNQGVDSFSAQLLSYADRTKAMLESTTEANTPVEATIYGSKGTIRLFSRFHHCERIAIQLHEKSEEIIHIPYVGNGYFHEIEEVNHCLLANAIESTKMPHQMSLNLIKLMDEIRKQTDLHYPADDRVL
ncbi:MAG: Gfo/Idh/MocA family oxidoreductase [Bacteroidales bacterium]|jgi:predicted dehydrogenase|nr:Gfo/Idh/MocA family oxidoreductase [Bacteroidales bacterium]HOI32812.1 Gfo/Idh/MocA family oxidoreductase [Bacteroidales bacterium]